MAASSEMAYRSPAAAAWGAMSGWNTVAIGAAKSRPVRADQHPRVRISGDRKPGAELEGVAEDVTVFHRPFADDGFCLAATRSIA